MKVDTRKSSIQVVIIRLLGELAAKPGAADLPLWLLESCLNAGLGWTNLTSSTLTHAGLAVK